MHSITLLKKLDKTINTLAENTDQELLKKKEEMQSEIAKLEEQKQQSIKNVQASYNVTISKRDVLIKVYQELVNAIPNYEDNMQYATTDEQRNHIKKLLRNKIERDTIKELSQSLAPILSKEELNTTIAKQTARLKNINTVQDCQNYINKLNNVNIDYDTEKNKRTKDYDQQIHQLKDNLQQVDIEQIKMNFISELRKTIKSLPINEKHCSIGRLHKENKNLNNWIFSSELQQVLSNNSHRNYLYIPYNLANDHIIASYKEDEEIKDFKDIVEYTLLKRSTQEATRIIYGLDYNSFFKLQDYHNVSFTRLNDTLCQQFISQATQYPKQRIVIMCDSNDLSDNLYYVQSMVKMKNIQFIVFHKREDNSHSELNDLLRKNFLVLTAIYSERYKYHFKINKELGLFVNSINNQGIEELKTLVPLEIEKENTMLNCFKAYIDNGQWNEEQLVINEQEKVDWNNMIITSSNQNKRIQFMEQLLFQLSLKDEPIFIYNNSESKVINKLIESHEDQFIPLYDDYMEDLVEEAVDKNVVIIEPSEVVSEYIEGLLEIAKTYVSMGSTLDGYNVLDLDQKEPTLLNKEEWEQVLKVYNNG